MVEELLKEFSIKYSREEIFALKFTGQNVPDNAIFKTFQAYSPTSRPKRIACSPLNFQKYAKFIVSMKKRIEESEQKGLFNY